MRQAIKLWGVAAVVTLTGCSSAASKPTVSPTPIDGQGTIVLTDGYALDGGSSCTGKGGFDDIATGAQVVVSDDSNKTLGLTTLGVGRLTAEGCSFSFTYADLPSGLGFYGVQVTHRGVVKETEATMMTGPALSLG